MGAFFQGAISNHGLRLQEIGWNKTTPKCPYPEGSFSLRPGLQGRIDSGRKPFNHLVLIAIQAQMKNSLTPSSASLRGNCVSRVPKPRPSTLLLDQRPERVRYAPGFSLIEMLAAIAVLAILAGILVIGIGRARESANRTQDLNNLRQLHAAWTLAATDQNGRVLMGFLRDEDHRDRPDPDFSFAHWPGRLAVYMDYEFPRGSPSVWLHQMPGDTVFRSPGAPDVDPDGNRWVSYGINILATGTYNNAGNLLGAMRGNMTRLDSEARVHQVNPNAILFANVDQSWHLGDHFQIRPIAGARLPENAAAALSHPWRGSGNYVRVDGSASSRDTVPEWSSWTVDGED